MESVATLTVNSVDTIQFVNTDPQAVQDSPTLLVQSGIWGADGREESGVIFDVSGNQTPLLTPQDARKLAKWLTRAADAMDGVKHSDKKHKARRHYETDDDEYGQY